MAKKDKKELPPILEGLGVPQKLKNLTGFSRGWLTVVGFGGRNSNNRPLWVCDCRCGRRVLIQHRMLVNNTKNLKHCGCLPGELQDLTGKRFGRLVGLEYTGKTNIQHSGIWLWQCDCGNKKEIACAMVTFEGKGRTESCGCLRLDRVTEASSTHGLTRGPKNSKKPRLFNIWNGMKYRCYNSNDILTYPSYGGRGITVCEEWRQSFESFYTWAHANGYRHDLSIDRIDVNGNYEPSNCRWATHHEQCNNKRKTKRHPVFGLMLTIPEASRRYRVRYSRLQTCMYKRKHSLEQAIIYSLKSNKGW